MFDKKIPKKSHYDIYYYHIYSGIPQKELAEKYGVNPSRISKIIRKFVPIPIKKCGESNPNAKLNNSKIHNAKFMREKGYGIETISLLLKVSISAISRALNGVSWKNHEN